MRVKMPDGTILNGKAAAIVRTMQDSHWTAADKTTQEYMEQVRLDALRFHGVLISVAGPDEFLASLAHHKMITIEEAA